MAVVLSPATAGERAAYERATSRRFAEWPLAEAAADAATSGFRPLPQTASRLPLVRATVLDVLERATAG